MSTGGAPFFPPPSLLEQGSLLLCPPGIPSPKGWWGVGGGCASQGWGVSSQPPPPRTARAGGWQLPASWARARASRSWHSCWHARQTPTATCSHPPTSAGAAGPSGFPGLPRPLPRALEPPPRPAAPRPLAPARSEPTALAHTHAAWELGPQAPGGSFPAAGRGRGARKQTDRPTDRVRAPPATWRRSSGTTAGSAVPGGNCRQTNLKR